MITKKCSKCEQVKEVCFFSKNNTIKDKLHCSCKECDKKKYFENRERNIVNMRNYKKNNSEKLKLYRDKKRDKKNEILSIKKKEYYEKNKDIILESAKKKDIQNKKKRQNNNKQYRENNLDSEKRRWKEYYEKNKKELINKSVINSLEKRKKYPIERLKHNVRNRVRDYIKSNGIRKTNTTFEIVGCSPLKLKIHLEQKFTEGMSWNNQGKWHIDHKIPLSSSNTEEELYKLCHFTNLQPMWASENIKKGSKIL